MRVLFDASVFGVAHRDLNGRTGVHRYTENLVKKLLQSKECEVSFSSSEGFQVLSHLHRYLKENPSFNTVPILEPKLTAKLYDGLYSLRPEGVSNPNFIKKVKRRLAWEGMQFLEGHSSAFSSDSSKGFDIFHSPFWPIPQVLRNNTKIKKFLTIHDLYSLKNHKNREVSLFEKALLNSITNNDFVFCVSNATKQDFLELKPGFNPEHVFLVSESISDTIHPVLEEVKSRTLSKFNLIEEKYFLSVGAIQERKNLPHLIRAFSELLKKENALSLKLVLVGPPREAHSKTLSELPEYQQFKNRIQFTGFLEDSDLSALYQGALGFVYPSLYEGFGIPILEAFRCGCPVITSNTSSMPEVAGQGALFVSPTSVPQLVEAMERLIKENSLRLELKSKALTQVAKFSWERCLDETLLGYHSALASS